MTTPSITSARRGLFRTLITVAVAAAAAGSLVSPARATEALQKRVAVIAKNVSTLLAAQQMKEISVGQFVGPPNFPTSSGPALVQMFNDEFKKHSIAVVAKCKIGISGEYSITEVKQFDSVAGKNVDHLAVKINGKLVNSFGSVLTSFNTEGIVEGKFEATVAGAETLVETLGLPADLPADATPAQIDTQLRDAVVKPTVTLQNNNTRYRASDSSPYSIEVLVDGHACPIVIENDLPYVDIAPGQIYAIKVYNDSDYECAVRLLIDGLSVFTFSDIRDPRDPSKPKYNVYIMDPHDDATLKGWHKDNQTVQSFLVTGYDNSAAAKLGHTQDLGTITLTFAAAWPKGSPPPPDEIITKSAGGNATGFGPPTEHKVHEVQNDIGRIRASLAIRYTK
jgi:hypothetical protein